MRVLRYVGNRPEPEEELYASHLDLVNEWEDYLVRTAAFSLVLPSLGIASPKHFVPKKKNTPIPLNTKREVDFEE